MGGVSGPLITFIGFGHMGRAFFEGARAAIPGASFMIGDPALDPGNLPEDLRNLDNASFMRGPVEAMARSGLFVFAVKPQAAPAVCAQWKLYVPKTAAVLSIAAGITEEFFARAFAKDQPVVRAMPNLASAIGKGIAGAHANAHVSPAQKALAARVLEAGGPVIWLEDEGKIDAVTAISGSGPAYYFYFTEALARAGEALGLSAGDAALLARQTAIGAGAALESFPDVDAAEYRRRVTSPGGTTQAALEILMNGVLQDLLEDAARAAEKRGAAMGKASG